MGRAGRGTVVNAADCTPGLAVVYHAHPDAEPEDGEVLSVASPPIVMVAYRSGPQAGKTCATYARDLEPAR